MTNDEGAAITGGTGTGHRSVGLTRTATGEFDVTNERGGQIHLGTGADGAFTPVELLLAAIAGCSAVDVDFLTTKRVEPDEFAVHAAGEKVSGADGNVMRDLRVSFTVTFPDGPDGEQASARLPKAIDQSHTRLCTVSRTVEAGTPIVMQQR